MSKVIRRARLSGAGLDFTLSNVEDEAGLYQGYLTDLAGWFGGVGVSANDSQRPLGHGLFASRSFRTGREITLSGTLVFRSESDRLVADRFLSGLLWDGEFGTLTVDTDDVSASAVVKLSGEVQHSYYGSEAIKVQIPLTAPDPFLYGPARRYQLYPAGFGEGLDYPLFGAVPSDEGEPVLDWGSGTPYSGAFGNSGNATAYPVFTVRGDWPGGFTLTESGRSLTFSSPVDESTPVVVDMKAGAVYVAGEDQTHRLTRRAWFGVEPEESIQPRITALAPSTGWCDVEIHDTYI